MQMSPVIAIHMSAALAALAIGPVALWARRRGAQRPRLHRAAGHAWVTLMLATAISAMFIRDFSLPNIGGYTPIHLLVPVTLVALAVAFVRLARGDVAGHASTMRKVYIAACLVAGAFTLLPNRYLGDLLWVQTLGLFAPHVSGMPLRPASLAGGILLRTPAWVWGLLAALIGLGLSQTRQRSAGLARVAILPVAMGALSLSGTLSAFGASIAVLATWTGAAAAAALAWLSRPTPAAVRYDAATRRFDLPGSWVPMLLILGIFSLRYAVNVSLALDPALAADPLLHLGVPLLYGALTGLFAGRAMALLRLVIRPSLAPVALQA